MSVVEVGVQKGANVVLPTQTAEEPVARLHAGLPMHARDARRDETGRFRIDDDFARVCAGNADDVHGRDGRGGHLDGRVDGVGEGLSLPARLRKDDVAVPHDTVDLDAVVRLHPRQGLSERLLHEFDEPG